MKPVLVQRPQGAGSSQQEGPFPIQARAGSGGGAPRAQVLLEGGAGGRASGQQGGQVAIVVPSKVLPQLPFATLEPQDAGDAPILLNKRALPEECVSVKSHLRCHPPKDSW